MSGPQPGYPPPYPAPPAGIGYPPPPPPAPIAAAPTPPRPRKSPVLGRTALAISVLMAVISAVSVVPLATLQAQLIASTGTTDTPSGLLAEIWMASATAPMLIWVASILGSLTAMIVGIIAVITARGRATGIVAVIVGLLSPVVWITCWLIVTLPVASAVS